MNPGELDSTAALASAFARRQHAAGAEGQGMTSALVQTMQYELPGNLLDGLPPLFITYFFGQETAPLLGINDGAIAGELQLRLSGQVPHASFVG